MYNVLPNPVVRETKSHFHCKIRNLLQTVSLLNVFLTVVKPLISFTNIHRKAWAHNFPCKMLPLCLLIATNTLLATP